MYPNLRAEIARCGFNMGDVASQLGVSLPSFSLKMKEGKFTLAEARRLKQIVKTDLPLEVLFEEVI